LLSYRPNLFEKEFNNLLLSERKEPEEAIILSNEFVLLSIICIKNDFYNIYIINNEIKFI